MWLITQIVHKTASRDLDEWGMARLDSRVMSRVMHENSVSAVVEALESGAIEVDHGYGVGNWCKGYRMDKRFLGVSLSAHVHETLISSSASNANNNECWMQIGGSGSQFIPNWRRNSVI